MTQPRELEVVPTTMICVIPRTPASTDNLSLQQIYDNQAQYLGTERHQPTHTELAQMACSTASARRCRCPQSSGRTGTRNASS